jgi:hypothetical protein
MYNRVGGFGLDSSGSEYELVAEYVENGNDHSVSINGREFLGYLRLDCQERPCSIELLRFETETKKTRYLLHAAGYY